MIVCRKDRDAACPSPSATHHAGGPVYLPRRRTSKIAEELLARPLAVAPLNGPAQS